MTALLLLLSFQRYNIFIHLYNIQKELFSMLCFIYPYSCAYVLIKYYVQVDTGI